MPESNKRKDPPGRTDALEGFPSSMMGQSLGLCTSWVLLLGFLRRFQFRFHWGGEAAYLCKDSQNRSHPGPPTPVMFANDNNGHIAVLRRWHHFGIFQVTGEVAGLKSSPTWADVTLRALRFWQMGAIHSKSAPWFCMDLGSMSVMSVMFM